MAEKKQIFHGSDLEKIEELYGIPKESIVPFGGNVNPLGISPLLRKSMENHIDAISSYPDRDYKTLRSTLSDYCSIPMEHIMVGNGSTELIGLAIRTLLPKKTILIAPTYSEYTREIQLTGGAIETYILDESKNFDLNMEQLKKSLDPTIDLLAICNPNNPTSSAINTDQLRALLHHCRSQNIFVLIDETYVEFAPDPDHISAVPLTTEFENLMILRGTSKFFAAPGLRLGYAVCGSQHFLRQLSIQKNPWTINTLAALAGEAMFMDQDYIRKTKSFIDRERTRCLHTLAACDSVKAYPAYANFILVKLLEGTTSHKMFERCIRRGLMIRDCSSFQELNGEFIRFCIRLPEENTKLLSCLCE